MEVPAAVLAPGHSFPSPAGITGISMGHPPRAPAPRAPASRTPRRRGLRRTVVLGVTGLPAAGKSLVARLFADLGADLADADALAHAALDRPSVARAVGRLLGPGVLLPGGRVDRPAVAARVFGPGDARRLAGLTAIVHPVVHRGLRAAVTTARSRQAPAVVLDVPLLFEAGVDGMCDATIFVDAPRGARLRRARTRGWTPSDLRAREARQAPAAERRRRADYILRNGGDRAAVRRAVGRLWEGIVGAASAGAPGRA